MANTIMQDSEEKAVSLLLYMKQVLENQADSIEEFYHKRPKLLLERQIKIWEIERNLQQSRIESSITPLILKYYATIEIERDLILEYLKQKKIKYDKLDNMARLLLKLNRFSCLLEYETGGNAVCKEIMQTDNLYEQYAEKLRQAVKPEDFRELEVTLEPNSIFKLENKILSKDFHRLVARESLEVKEMFYIIQKSNLQWVATFGFRKEFSSGELDQLFDNPWDLKNDPQSSKIMSILKDKSQPQFPIILHKYLFPNKYIQYAVNNFYVVLLCKVAIFKTSSTNLSDEGYIIDKDNLILPEAIFMYKVNTTLPALQSEQNLLSIAGELLYHAQKQSLSLNKKTVQQMHQLAEVERAQIASTIASRMNKENSASS